MSNDKPKYKYLLEEVTLAAKGKWLAIFGALAPKLNDAISALNNGKRYAHVTDPVNGTKEKNGKGDGFRLHEDASENGQGYSNKDGFISNGFRMLMWANNCSFREALEDVGDFLCLDQNQYNAPTRIVPSAPVYKPRELTQEEKDEIEKFRQKNLALFSEAVPLSRAPKFAWRYLQSRGIDLRSSIFENVVRFHPSVPYWHESEDELDSYGKSKLICLGNFPTFLSSLSNEDKTFFNLHRTYITPLGEKASVPKSKKLGFAGKASSTPTDAFIRLGGNPINGVLGVAEGIETALSGIRAYNLPVWAAYSSSLLKSRDVPVNVHTVLIFADKDRPTDNLKQAGWDAASKLKRKLQDEGKTVHILLPEDEIPDGAKSVDWNDVLLKYGVRGFPSITQLLGRKAS